MELNKKIEQEMIKAAKAKEKIRLSALRMMKNAVHNKEIDLKRELTEAEFLQVLAVMVKQRKDSIEQFEKGGRMDLVEKETSEPRFRRARSRTSAIRKTTAPLRNWPT